MMDYYALLEKQPQNKVAIIADGQQRTYGDLCRLIKTCRSLLDFSAPCAFLQSDSIITQLEGFLIASGTQQVPVLATKESKKEDYDFSNIPENACMGVLTSGSRGKSKLLWRSFASWADFFPEQNRIFGIDDRTVIFCQGSLAFTGNLNIYMGVLAAGGTIVCTEKFLPKHWLHMIAEHKVNSIYLIPSKLMLLPKFMAGQNENIRAIVSGSQSMGRGEADKLLQAFPKADITLYYGATELNYISYIKGSDMTDDRTDVGVPFKGVSVSVQDKQIYIDTPYHVEEIAMPFTLKDCGSIDEQGHVHFLGRADDILSVNGRKVSSVRVTEALECLDGVLEAAVLCVHENDADILTAYIGSEREYSKQELVSLLRRGGLEDYELPKRFIVLPALPKNESGKIDVRHLK